MTDDNPALTLATYEPGSAATAALAALGFTYSQSWARCEHGRAAAMFMAQAVVLDELIQLGVTPYAEAPGVSGEPDMQAVNDLHDWINLCVVRAMLNRSAGRHVN